MKRVLVFSLTIFLFISCSTSDKEIRKSDWDIGILPSSIRLDPVTNEIIDSRFVTLKDVPAKYDNLYKSNWIYDGERVTLYSARGEYISFQFVLKGTL